MATETEIKKAIAFYIEEHTTSVSPPDCNDCNELAVVYDTLDGENYCLECLDKSLRKDEEDLFSHVKSKM